MQKQVTYYDNLEESFKNGNFLEPASPHIDILRFEEIPPSLQESTENPFRLNAFVIGLVTDGKFHLNISNEEYAVSKNSLYFTSPWHIRQYSYIEHWKGYILFFTPEFIYQYPQGEYIFQEFRFFHNENGMLFHPNEPVVETLQQQLEKMHLLLRGHHPEKMKLLFHYVNIFLYECKAAFASDVVFPAPSKDTTLNAFLNTINNYFIDLNKGQIDAALTLKYVAREMHLHPTYLSNLLKQQTGKTAAQLLRERLVLEAQSLLKSTSMTVAEVAYYLHFKDNSNFAKFFRHQVGQSPTEYRDKS